MNEQNLLLHFDKQVASDLEFDVIREMLAKKTVQPTAELRAQRLSPLRNRKQIIKFLEETEELRRLKTEQSGFPAIEFEELQKEIKLLGLPGSVLTEDGFNRIARASNTVNSILAALHGGERISHRLNNVFKNTFKTSDIIKPIEKVFDQKGQVRDDASPALANIREEMQSLRRSISRRFNKVLKDLLGKGMLADTREGFVNERRVLAVESTYKRRVKGNVCGSSNTGTITFIEPSTVVPLNHELELLRDDERKELRRILKELTKLIRGHLPLIKEYNKALIEYDFIQARAALAVELECVLPSIAKSSTIKYVKAYHPLLVRTNRALKIPTQPQSFELTKNGRILIISGPNAGGKSITLKTVGLLQVMLQSGLLIPVNSASEVGLFDSILTDIGDNQSIENQLSTYSYRLSRMQTFLRVADAKSLLLLDEFGTGSDPELGGALAEVFFEELYNKGVYGVITTHYANIKSRASELKNAVNASMLFNRNSLEPLFKLEVGQPGSSFTFEVASNCGINKKLIARAKTKLDGRRVELDSLIGELQKEKATIAKLTSRQLRAELEAEKATMAAKKASQKIKEKSKQLSESEAELNDLALKGEVLEKFIKKFNPGADNTKLSAEILDYLDKHSNKSRVKGSKNKAKKAKVAPIKKRPNHNSELIKEGSTVRLRTGKEKGEVVAVKGKKVTVVFGDFKTVVDRNKLSLIK